MTLTGCAHIRPNAEARQQVESTAHRVAQLEEAVRLGERDVQRIRQTLASQVAGHEGTLETLDSELQRLQVELEAWHLELRQLRGLVRTSLRADEQWKRHVDGRLEHIEGMLGVQSPPLGALPPEPSPPAPSPPDDPDALLPDDLPGDASGLLARAQRHLRSDEPAVARAILEHALARHGEAAEAPELQYRLAETWFAEERWSRATSAFQAMAEAHPDSDWAAWALVRQGECFRAMGDPDTARIYFEDAVRLHADTKAAEAAKKLSDGLL